MALLPYYTLLLTAILVVNALHTKQTRKKYAVNYSNHISLYAIYNKLLQIATVL